MNCQHCQPLLLDHLYGLLDGPEAAAVDAHLASCPACTAARAETARVQGLFARAAKSAFPATRFEAPVPAKTGARTPAPASKPSALPFPAPLPRPGDRTFRVAGILSWAVAAAVLIAIPGTVVPVLGIFDRSDAADRAAGTAKLNADAADRAAGTAAGAVETAKNQRQSSLSAAQLRLTVAEQTQTALLNTWVKEQKVAAQTATARKLTVDVLKPATVQPGAPNDFLVVVRDGRERWETVGKRMVAEVHAVEASDAVIFTQPLDHERRGDTHALRLPAAAWAQVKPDAELFLVVAQVDEKTGARTELQERVRLAGPVFATLLVTDKPTYRPGERLFFRSLTLDRVTFRPPAREQILKYELVHPDNRAVNGLTVTGTTGLVRVGGGDGKVEAVRAADGQPVRGVGCGEFVLPPDLADGDYTLVLREQQHPGGPAATVPLPVTRLVKVRSGAADNYRKQIEFKGRASYAAGETVEAWAELTFQDKPVPNAAVAGVAIEADGLSIDGVQASKETDKDGKVHVRFALPAELLDGDVRLKVAFRTPHGEEVVARRVPVIGNRLKVEFFPECGDMLVAGVPCKVYVRATTPAGQPADIRGVVTDGREVLARVESLSDTDQPGANRGLASFTYTPKLGTRAWLKLDAPAGVYAPILTGVPVSNAAVALMGGPGATAVRTGFPLPRPEATGVVMSVLDPITAPGQPIRVQLHSVGQARTLVVGAYTRGRLSDTQKVTVEPDLAQVVKLMAGTDPRGGVVRITAFEELTEQAGEPKPDLKPVAERLVFRKPGEVLNLGFAATSVGGAPGANRAFAAGSEINLSITATDEKGNPAAAVLWAAACNSGAAPGAKDRLLPTHFLLGGEVKNPDDLEYADFLLTDRAKAGEALDLVLGTQGWRRFAEQAQPPAAPVQKAGVPNTEVTRLMVQNGQYATWTEPVPLRDHRKLFETYAPLYEAAVKAVTQAKAGLELAREETRDVQEFVQAASAERAAKRAADEAAKAVAAETAKAQSAREPVRQFRSGVWYGVAGLAALALCCGLASLARPDGRFPLGFSTLGSVGLAAFLVVAAGWGDDAKASAAAPARESASAEAERAGAGFLREDRGPAPVAAGPTPAAPAPKAGAAPDAKGNAEMGKPTTDGVMTGAAGMTGAGPAKGAAALAFGGGPLKDVPPPFIMSPPTVNKHDGRLGPAALPQAIAPGGPGGAPAPLARPGDPSMRPMLIGPPGPVPSALGAGGDHVRPNGVTEADLADSEKAKLNMLRGSGGRNAYAAEQADALKRDTDRAARFAKERATALTAAVEAYHAAAGKPSLPAIPPADKFAAQQSRAPVPPLVVREYAAPRPASIQVPDATEAPDTVLWQPVIVLPADGKATLTFHLGAAPGGYQLVIAGHTADGRLGATRGLIAVSRPQTAAPVGPGAPAGAVPPTVPVAPGPRPMP